MMQDILKKDVQELSASELKHLEDEFESWMAQTDEIKKHLKKHQEFHKNRQTEELRENLKNIDSRVEEHRKHRVELEGKLNQLRTRESQISVVNDNLEEELHDLELEHQMENIAVLRIKAERLREKREQLEKVEQARKMEIDAILEENKVRHQSGEKMLGKLLDKVETLKKELQAPEYDAEDMKKDLVADFIFPETMGDLEDENEQDMEQIGRDGVVKLFDTVSAVRESRWQSKLKKLEDELSGLCAERSKLMEEEDRLKQKKRDHRLLVNQGLDYLVELEFGNVSLKKLIIENMHADEESPRTRKEYDGTELDDLDEEEPAMEELIQRVEENVAQASFVITAHAKEIAKLEKERRIVENQSFLRPEDRVPYDGSMGRSSYPSHKKYLYDMMRELLLDTVEDMFSNVLFDRDQMKLQAQGAFAQWMASKKVLKRQLEEKEREDAIHCFTDDIIVTVIESIVRGIYGEFHTAGVLSARVATKLILGSVFSLYKDRSQISDTMKEHVTTSFGEMQKRREHSHTIQRKTSRIPPTMTTLKLEKPLLPQDVSVFYSTNAAYSAESMHRIKEELSKRRALENAFEEKMDEKRHHLDAEPGAKGEHDSRATGKHEGDGLENESSDEEDEDDDVVELNFGLVSLFSPEKLAEKAPEFETLEKSFWNHVQFRSKHFQVSQRIFGTPSCMKGNSTGEFLAIGTGLGSLLIFDLRPEKHVRLIRKYLDKKGPKNRIVQIEWSLDVGTMIVTLDECSVVRLWSTQTQPDTKKESFAKKKSGNFASTKTSNVETLELRMELSWKDFERPEQENFYEEEDDIRAYEARVRQTRKNRKANKKNQKASKESEANPEEDLRPMKVGFHTSHTMFGKQTSLMVGLKNGTIVKLNTEFDSEAGDRSIFCPVYALNEPANPLDPSFVPGKPRAKGQLFGSTIKREFFQDHKHEVIHLGFANRSSEILLSLDSRMKMRIWSYAPSQFSGFGWFVPLHRFQLDLKAITFMADKSKKVEEMFPPEGVHIPGSSAAIDEGGRKPKENESEDDVLRADKDFMKLVDEEMKIISSIGLHKKPWLERPVGNKGRNMQVYAPEHIELDGSYAHQVLIFTEGGILVKRMLSYFHPIVFQGHLVDVTTTHSGSEVVFLVQYPGSAEKNATLRLFVFDLATLSLEETAFEVTLLGSLRPRFIVSPVIRELGSDYAYILMDNVVYIVSLTSGQYVTRPLAPVKDEPNVNLFDLEVLRNHEHIACIGVNEETVYLFSIENMNRSSNGKEGPKSNDYRPRMDHSPRECDV